MIEALISVAIIGGATVAPALGFLGPLAPVALTLAGLGLGVLTFVDAAIYHMTGMIASDDNLSMFSKTQSDLEEAVASCESQKKAYYREKKSGELVLRTRKIKKILKSEKESESSGASRVSPRLAIGELP